MFPEALSGENLSLLNGYLMSAKQDSEQEIFGGLLKFLHRVVKSAFYVSRRKLWGKTVYFEKIVQTLSLAEVEPGTFGLF